MKKDLIFAPILFAIGLALCLLSVTGMVAHIVISVVGVAALIAYTVVAKKNWKIPALEIAMRASYGVALISGVVIKINHIAVLAVMHKIFAVLFVAFLIVTLVHKVVTAEEK